MIIDENKMPVTVEEAIETLYNTLTDADKTEISRIRTPESIHFTLGRHLRNSWSFWGDAPLKRDFIERYKLFGHGDDLSGIILNGLFAKCMGKDVQESINNSVDIYKKHWIRAGLCPLSGHPLKTKIIVD